MTERANITANETVRFIGNWHESIPRILFMDPFMNSYDRNVYCVIRSLMSEKGVVTNREMKFPTYNEIMKYGNIGSTATIAKAITVARLIGWIVQNNPSGGMARDETSGRFKSKHWLIIDEPMPHSEICHYDHEFVAFIKEATKHRDTQVSSLAQKVHMALMDDDIDEDHQSIYARRIDAHRAVTTNPATNSKRTFFGIPITEKKESPTSGDEHGEKSPTSPPKHGKKQPISSPKHGEYPPTLGDEHGGSHQNRAKTPASGDEHGKKHRLQEMNTVPSSSSSSSKKTTTTKTEITNQRKKLYERIGFNPNYQTIYTARFEKLPDEYQDLVILEMNERMNRKLNRNDVAYLGHLLKTTLEAVKQDDPGLLIFTSEYSSPSPAEKQAKSADPVKTLKLALQNAHADHRHWQDMQHGANEAQSKQVQVMVDMAKTKIETLESKLTNMQA